VTADELQDLLDKLFPNGATARMSADYLIHVPRIMVVGVKGEEAMVVLTDVLEADPPAYVVVSLPEENAKAPLKLDTDSDLVDGGQLEITDVFPAPYKEMREEALKSAWYQLDEQSDAPADGGADDAPKDEDSSDG
jgi:hypothetical protein